ncbi:MAG: endonuclease III [Bacilli bacterium]|nr:endonuclease III [Bacilli bacterium]
MNSKEIENYLDFLFVNPRCELNYTKDYELLIAVVLSAQTTDKRVNMVTSILFDKYNTLEKLRDADIEDIINIIRPIGTFNKKSIFVKKIASFLLDNCDGKVPNDESILIKIPGVGRKTSNVVRSNLFNYPAIAVDTHVNRVSKRLNIANEKDDVLIVEKKLMKYFPKKSWSKLHHQMVLFGRYYCTSNKPKCEECKLNNICKYYIKNIKK